MPLALLTKIQYTISVGRNAHATHLGNKMTKKSLSLITSTLLLTANIYADETLEPITVVSTNKTAQSITNTTSNIEVITAEEIEEKGYQTVAQAINTVAGISVASSGGLGQQTSFFVRGADSGKVLVLLDGMRLNDPSSPNGTAYIETLTTANIQQIEILKGGSSSIWGSNASAGVINIITKEAKAGVHGSVGLSYGSYNTRGADADLSYKDEKLTAQVLASYLKTDGFSALAPRSAEDDGYKNKNYNIKFGYTFDTNNQLSLSYNRIETDTEYDAGSAEDGNSNSSSVQANYALDYNFDLDSYGLQFHASKGTYKRNSIDTFGVGNYDATIKEYSLLNTLDYTSGRAILGFEYKNIDGTSDYTSPYYTNFSDASYKNKTIFLSNTYNVNENTLLETNLRYDNFDAFENKTTYKIGFKHNHNFLEGFTSTANYYTSYDAPSSYQLANTFLGESLNPSYTKGFDISANYKKLFSLTYFNNKIEDGFGYKTDPLTYVGGYYNIDRTEKFTGLEVQSSYALPSLNLNLSANYTHLLTYEKADGTNHIRRPKDTLNASVDYYTDSNTHFGIDAQYIGDREDSDFDPITFAPISVTTGNYTLWNLNFDTKIIKNVDLNINAKNIFDKEYQSVYGYATEGRSVYAKLKYSF